MKDTDEFKRAKLNYAIVIRAPFKEIERVEELLNNEIDSEYIVFSEISTEELWVQKRQH